MSAFSILNNAQAASALFNLGKTQKSLNMVQERINTGLRVGSAKDNASTFSVSLGMKNDVAGFKAIRETIALGKGTVDVALNASERVSDLLGQLKEKAVQAQSENVDRAALQRDISQIRDQINTIVSSAQFNGVNMVGDTASAAAGKTLKVLASLDRASASSAPTPSFIEVSHQDISTSKLGKTSTTDSIDTINVNRTNLGKNAGIASMNIDFDTNAPAVGDTVQINVRDQEGNLFAFTMTAVGGATANVNEFDQTSVATATADIVAKLNSGAVTGVQVEDADGNAVALADAKTVTFGDTGITATDLTAAGYADGGITLTDADEADAYGFAQNGVGGNDQPFAADTAGVNFGYQTFAADANTVTVGFEKSTLTLSGALAAGADVTLRLTGPNGEDLTVSLAGAAAATGDGSDFAVGSAGNGTNSLATELETAILAAASNAGLTATSLNDLGLAINQDDTAGSIEVVTTNTGEGVAVRGFAVTDDTGTGEDLAAKAVARVSNDRAFALTLEGEIEKVEAAVQQMQEITATFGSISQRLDMQDEFLESLTNTLNDGISQMIDANMAEESAKFQALQVQQQLGLQALSIANQAPQAVLGLFR